MSDTLQMCLWGVGLLLVVWVPTFGITYFVMSSRHKKKVAASAEDVGLEVAAAGAVSLGVALVVSVGVVLVLGACAVVAAIGFVALACSGH